MTNNIKPEAGRKEDEPHDAQDGQEKPAVLPHRRRFATAVRLCVDFEPSNVGDDDNDSGPGYGTDRSF